MIQQFIESLLDTLVTHATDILLPFMGILFVAGIALRVLLYFTVKRNEWFVKEFEKRVNKYLASDDMTRPMSFFVIVKKLLEKTFYEVFEVRGIMKRRKPDFIMPMSDRVFLIKQGAAWVVKDSLGQIKHLKFNSKQSLIRISKTVFQRNPCFNRVFGIIPAPEANDILGILPGVFIVAGIFGTFLGIMKALPELSGMDLADVDQTKVVMDQFLLKTAFAMSTSLVGIMFSLVMLFINTSLSPEKVFVRSVDRFESALDLIWNRSDNNELPKSMSEFDENRDPIEALAEAAIENTLAKKKKSKDPLRKAS